MGKPGGYNEESRPTVSRFSESRIPNRFGGESSCPTPLNCKPDAEPVASTTVSRRVTADVYLRICILGVCADAEYHLPCRDVYYAALKPTIHMGCRRTRDLSTNVTRRGFLSLGLPSPCSETRSRRETRGVTTLFCNRNIKCHLA